MAGVRSVGPLALAGVPAMLPVAIGIAWGRVKELLTHGNFQLADAGTGVRVHEGLTDLRTTTIPLHRIQALEVVQPLWWRWPGWWRIRVNVAGTAGPERGEEQRESTLLPVGTFDDVRRVLALLAPRVPAEAWAAAALGDGPDPRWRPVSRRARFLDPLSWRRNAWSDGATAVLLRVGTADPARRGRPARPHPVADGHARAGSSRGSASPRCTSCRRPGPVAPVLAHLERRRRPSTSSPRSPGGPAPPAAGQNPNPHLLHPTRRGWWTGPSTRST